MNGVVYSDGAIALMANALQRKAPMQAGALYVVVAAEMADAKRGHTGRLITKALQPLRKKQLIERRDIGIGVLRWFPTDAGRRVVSYFREQGA